jgi:alpha-amylase/alpha-mannosidase (GH57 family)
MTLARLAVFWHQHQPYYPDRFSRETWMPWVRLHAIKDYWGMAAHLQEVPEFRCTINLVPSLLQQLLAYVDEGASDTHLDLSRIPADSLSDEEARLVLEQFFMANLESMIRPLPRYFELWQKRGPSEPLERVLKRFTTQDFRDLQVLSNLAWMHPLLFERDAELRTLRDKQRDYSETDKAWLLQRQREVMAEVVPMHRQLSDSGQVELTTTPYYHPILPLLWDKRSARQAMPGCALPQALDPYREDARLQLQRAVASHRQWFGTQPKGMWPSEGSVSQEILGAIAEVGIEWIATDEEILTASTQGAVGREGNGYVRRPELLYRPWQVGDGQHTLAIVFRDHALSDLIGFQYQRSDPLYAANDILGRVEAIAQGIQSQQPGQQVLVPIILDGENCWEYYPDGGVQFLRQFYRSAVQRPSIRPVTISQAIQEHPPVDRLPQLSAGSWISHNFAIWIGHSEDNRAWDLLHETREYLQQAEASGQFAAQQLHQAWEEIYIAEGSDWYWWFGDDHSSAQDDLFDRLFRKHLKNVYLWLKQPYPAHLDRPISQGGVKVTHTQPQGLLSVKVDGRQSFFEWINAGRYEVGNDRGTMTIVTKGPVQTLSFGFGKRALLIRLDGPQLKTALAQSVDEVRVTFATPAQRQVRLQMPTSTEPLHASVWHAGQPLGEANPEIRVALEQILEVAIPLDVLGVGDEQPVEFAVELMQSQCSLDRLPREGLIALVTPSPHFEQRSWQV